MQHFVFSQRSENCLSGVHPDLVCLARRALVYSEVDFCITEGIRTKERQKNLFVQGKSHTMHSRHLTGHAIDVAAVLKGNVSWDWPLYELIHEAFYRASGELKIPFEWGGSWTTLRDGPHYQLPVKDYP